jgi:hypothetical protein
LHLLTALKCMAMSRTKGPQFSSLWPLWSRACSTFGNACESRPLGHGCRFGPPPSFHADIRLLPSYLRRYQYLRATAVLPFGCALLAAAFATRAFGAFHYDDAQVYTASTLLTYMSPYVSLLITTSFGPPP